MERIKKIWNSKWMSAFFVVTNSLITLISFSMAFGQDTVAWTIIMSVNLFAAIINGASFIEKSKKEKEVK